MKSRDLRGQPVTRVYTRAQVDGVLCDLGRLPSAGDADIRAVASLQIQMSLAGIAKIDDKDLDVRTSRLLRRFATVG